MLRGNDGNEIMIVHQTWLADNLLEAAAHYNNTAQHRYTHSEGVPPF